MRQRAEALDAKRRTADAELTRATEARQSHFVEGDLGDAKAAQMLQDAVNVAASAVVGLEDAIVVVRVQIAKVEQKLADEQSAVERKAASEKLACDLDAVEKALPNCVDAGRRLVSSLEELHHNFEATQIATFLASTLSQVEVAAASVLTEQRAIVRGIADGTMPIPAAKPEPAPVVSIEPPPTMTVFLLKSARYRDHEGRKRFGGQFLDVVMPVATAQKAMRLGLAVPTRRTRVARPSRGVRGGASELLSAPDVVDMDAAGGSRERSTSTRQRPVLRAANFTAIDRGPERILMVTP